MRTWTRTALLLGALSALPFACSTTETPTAAHAVDTGIADSATVVDGNASDTALPHDARPPTDPGPMDVAPDTAAQDTAAQETTAADTTAADATAETGTDAIADATADVGEPPVPPPPFATSPDDRVGVAVVDATPTITETFTDTNGNHLFDGCKDDPSGTKKGCDEPFDDANKNGIFDAVFIAGYDALRPALTVHDPIEVRAMVLARGDTYLVIVGVDLIGLGVQRIQDAQLALEKKGFDRRRILVSSSHTHQGPDVRGLWGDPTPGSLWSGVNPAYNAWVTTRIVEAVEKAAATLVPVEILTGSVPLRDRSDWFNGANFGGKNTKATVLGLTHDGRDPIVVSDQVFALHARKKGTGEGVATLINFSGHPEVVGDENNALSADYVYYTRKHVEAALGGTAVFVPESLGGMQSALGAPTPLVDEKGAWVYETDAGGLVKTDKDGDAIPVWAPKNTFDFARSVGVHVADAAIDVIKAAKPQSLAPFEIRTAPFYPAVDNGAFQILFLGGLFDIESDLPVTDPALCPEWLGPDSTHPGCVPITLWHVRLADVEFTTAPGELLPELFWGFPEADPRWTEESTTVAKRGADRGSVYFPQHDPDCDAVPYAQCIPEVAVGDCDCTKVHAVPYALNVDATLPPIVTLLKAKHRFLIGNVQDHLGYIIPEPDFNKKVNFLVDGLPDGDHYEETVSLSYRFASKLQAALVKLLTP